MKRFLLFFLMLSLATLGYCYDFEYEGITYIKTSDTTVSVTGGGTIIPETITPWWGNQTYTVTGIANHAYSSGSQNNYHIIDIPKTVTNIGEYNQEIKGKMNVEIIPVSA